MNSEALVIALTLTLLNPAHDAEYGIKPRQTYEIALYDSRIACDHAAVAIQVIAKGARVKCQPRLLSPDERNAVAWAPGGTW